MGAELEVRRRNPITEGVRYFVVRQANWQKVGGASPPWRMSNQLHLSVNCAQVAREGACEASVTVQMGGAAIEHRMWPGLLIVSFRPSLMVHFSGLSAALFRCMLLQ